MCVSTLLHSLCVNGCDLNIKPNIQTVVTSMLHIYNKYIYIKRSIMCGLCHGTWLYVNQWVFRQILSGWRRRRERRSAALLVSVTLPKLHMMNPKKSSVVKHKKELWTLFPTATTNNTSAPQSCQIILSGGYRWSGGTELSVNSIHDLFPNLSEKPQVGGLGSFLGAELHFFTTDCGLFSQLRTTGHY